MSFDSYRVPQPVAPSAPPPLERVRWTFGDMLLVLISGVAAGAILLSLSLWLPALLGFTALRDALRSHPLAANMLLGGVLYGLFALATGILIVRRKRVSWQAIGFRPPPLLPLLLTPLLFIGQMTLLVVINAIVAFALGEFENPQVAALTDPRGFSWLNFVAVFVVGAIVAPIVEELLFRGLLYQWLRARTSVAVAVIASAAIFSAVHVIPIAFPALFAVGVVLALAFEYSRSLWVNITLHFMQNSLVITLLFVAQAYGLLPKT